MSSLSDRFHNTPTRPWPDEPVPIALVITDLDVGGAERSMVALATRLNRRRWAPQVVALAARGALADELDAAGIRCSCLGVNRRRPIQAVCRLAAVFNQRKPWLVQSFLFHANVAARLAAPLAGWPKVVGGFRVAEREKLWHLTLERLTQRLSVGSVCVSEGVAEYMRARGGWPADRLLVIPNGVDVGRFEGVEPLDRTTLGVTPGQVLALFVGRIEAQKDLDTLLKASQTVLEACPHWRLLIAGEGPDRVRLERESSTVPGLAESIRWLGFRADIPRLLATADLLVLPSRWEGMPNAVIEAMAAGKAVVATDVEGTRDLVLPGTTGWLVPPAAPESLAAALIEAANRADLRRRFGLAGKQRIARHFSLDSVVNQYEALWARILGLMPPPSPHASTRLGDD